MSQLGSVEFAEGRPAAANEPTIDLVEQSGAEPTTKDQGPTILFRRAPDSAKVTTHEGASTTP